MSWWTRFTTVFSQRTECSLCRLRRVKLNDRALRIQGCYVCRYCYGAYDVLLHAAVVNENQHAKKALRCAHKRLAVASLGAYTHYAKDNWEDK